MKRFVKAAVSDEPFVQAVVVAFVVFVVIVAVGVAAGAPSSMVGKLVVVVAELASVLLSVFETSTRGALVTVALFFVRPCWLSLQRDAVDIVAIWMQRCCHVCVASCNVGRRAILPGAIRVGTAGRLCLA